MMEDILAFTGRMAKIEGAPRSGKTEAIVRYTAQLLTQGTDPQKILVVASNGFSVQALRDRLVSFVPEDQKDAAQHVHITTALEECVRVLNTKDARESTGRIPRLLTRAEYLFFLEDIRTTGETNRKLRNMVSYFYREMENYTPFDDWMVGVPEKNLLKIIRTILTSRNAMLPSEAPMLAADFLKSDAGSAYAKHYDVVLCDDFQNLSHAQQVSMCLLAKDRVIVAGNPNETLQIACRHPYPQGFTEFDTLRRGVEVFKLQQSFGDDQVIAMANALAHHGDMNPAYASTNEAPTNLNDQTFCAVKWATPEEEANELTKYIRLVLDGDKDRTDIDKKLHRAPKTESDEQQEEIFEGRTCVVVPNKTWALMAKNLLEKRGFEVSCAGAFGQFTGDPRDTNRARALVAYTKLALLAHPQDLTSWRSWCGFNDHLTRSNFWLSLQNYAQEHEMDLYDALSHTLSDSSMFLRSEELGKRFEEGQEFIKHNAGRHGFDLLRAVGALDLIEFEPLQQRIVGDENAEQMFDLMRREIMTPTWPMNPHAIHISTMENLSGCEYDNVFFMAAIDGFVPRQGAFEVVSTDETRDRILNEDRRKFLCAISKANKRLIFSFFRRSNLELAARTNMQIVRVKSEDGKRIALTRPSHYLEEAGNAAPSTIGGQAFLGKFEIE